MKNIKEIIKLLEEAKPELVRRFGVQREAINERIVTLIFSSKLTLQSG